MNKPRFIPWLAIKTLTAFDKFIDLLCFEAKNYWKDTAYMEGLITWIAVFCFGGTIVAFFLPFWLNGFLFFVFAVPLGLVARAKYLDEVG